MAREYKTNERPDLFAATPPSEALAMLLSKLASKDKSMRMLYADVSRAYFYARSVRPIYVKLPSADPKSADSELCGRLRLSLYGTRDAAQNWHNEYASTLIGAGYVRGRSDPCLLWSQSDNVVLLVHGDGFCAVGAAESLKKLEKKLAIATKLRLKPWGLVLEKFEGSGC